MMHTREVADHLCAVLCRDIKGDLKPDQKSYISKVIKMCLKAKNGGKVKSVLAGIGVDLDGAALEGFIRKLGEEIPECWHHRLDQDIDNVFNPMEYVGYEADKEGHIIVAQIVHPVKPKKGEQQLEKKFRIYIGEDDKEGKDVGIFSLYKFLVGKKKPKLQPVSTESEERAVTPYDGKDDITNYRASLITEDLVKTKRKICCQLREIWKLPSDERRKAIKRMFLKWHPDKNTDSPHEAEIIFKFLMKQIEHLEKGEPLDDPTTDVPMPKEDTSSFHHSTGSGRSYRRQHYWHSNSRYYRNFNQWDSTAGRHRNSSNHEREYYTSGGGCGTTGSTDSRDGSHGTTGSSYSEGSYSRGSSHGDHSTTGSSDSRGSSHGGHGTTGSPDSRGSSRSSAFPFEEEQDEKNPEEGERWVKQAEAEFKVLLSNHKHADECSGYFYVCFMAHQVAEKALKGGVYALCGVDGRTFKDNNLARNALALETIQPEKTSTLSSHAISLEDYYLNPRYPSCWPGYTDIPAEHYTEEDSDQAKEHAEAVLTTVREIMPLENES